MSSLEKSYRSMGQQTSTLTPDGTEEAEDVHFYTKINEEGDQSLQLPNECLSLIFEKLDTADRNRCSLVCKRWNLVEAQVRYRLSLQAKSDIVPVLPALCHRFEHVNRLTLRCDRKIPSIDNRGICLAGKYFTQLERLKLRGCKQITDEGLEQFAKVCRRLKKFSCVSCSFGAKGINSILKHCSLLEDLTVKRLWGLAEGPTELIEPGFGKLRRLSLKELYNAQLFGPLIAGSKNLRSLLLQKNSGNWDKLLEIITEHIPDLMELHMERLHLSDIGLQAVSKCTNLEVLFVVKTPECTSYGLSAVTEGCRRLKKLRVDGWKSNNVRDEGLVSVTWKCKDLEELVLIGINVTAKSLELMASNCLRLKRLALCNSETVGDLALYCISVKCCALKRLCIKSCPITDEGMKALATGCPDLVKVKVKKCKGVTSESALFLQTHRPSLIVSLQDELQINVADAGRSEEDLEEMIQPSHGRSPLALVRLALATGGNFVTGGLSRRL